MVRKITRFRDIPEFIRSGSYECDYDIRGLWRYIKHEVVESRLDLDPDFQRGHVWSQSQQVGWLEFFLRGGVTGRVLYFNCPSWHVTAETDYDEFVIVDGKQRLESIRRFVEGEIKVFGSYFNEYTDSPRVRQTIKINVNSLPTRYDVLHWYLEMNEGGVVHSEDELSRVRNLILLDEFGLKSWADS
jgi:hypothetical protein